MSSAAQDPSPSEQVKVMQTPSGTASLVLGAVAVAMMGCPFLPEISSKWGNLVRLVPVYFIVPVGIWAVASGIVVLWKLRGQEGVRRSRARAGAGVTLGTMAILVPLALIVYAFWALDYG